VVPWRGSATPNLLKQPAPAGPEIEVRGSLRRSLWRVRAAGSADDQGGKLSLGPQGQQLMTHPFHGCDRSPAVSAHSAFQARWTSRTRASEKLLLVQAVPVRRLPQATISADESWLHNSGTRQKY